MTNRFVLFITETNLDFEASIRSIIPLFVARVVYNMYRVSPADVSKAEGELIRMEGIHSSLDVEFEKKAQESVELFVSLAESFSQVNISYLYSILVSKALDRFLSK